MVRKVHPIEQRRGFMSTPGIDSSERDMILDLVPLFSEHVAIVTYAHPFMNCLIA